MSTKKSLKVLVGLDLSGMDYYLIKYLNILDRILNIEQVSFLHNIKLGEIPKDFSIPDQLQAIQEKIEQKIKDQVNDSAPKYDYNIKVTSESYSVIAFDRSSIKKDFDLLILGNKQNLEGNGSLAQQLVGIFPAAILLVPETYRISIHKIMEAIDFSKYTPPIMEWAARFKGEIEEEKINHHAVHILKFYWDFYPARKVREIEDAIQRDTARKRAKWKESYAEFGDIDIVPAEDRSISTALLQYADKKRAGIMILGVLGSFGIKRLFMGSVANRLFGRATNTCLLFVRR